MKEKWTALIAEERPLKKRLILIIASAGLLAFTLGIFAPINIYLNNSGELWFRLEQFWWVSAIIGVVIFGLCMGIGLIARGKLFDLFVTLLFAVAVVLYLQGNFLNISYGELNGEQVNWSRYGGYALKNSALTAGLFLIPFIILYFSKKTWERMVRFIAFLLVSVQIVALIFTGFKNEKPRNKEMALGWNGISNYSQEENLVIIVIDAFDEPYFLQYLNSYPEQKDALDGFTYFKNTSGISLTTFYSMTPMLTGRVFDYNPSSYDEYMDLAWENATMFKKLQAANYDVRMLAPQESYIGSVRKDLFDNYIVGNRAISDYKKFARMLYDLVLYTYLPHVFKAGFWIYPDEFNYLQDKIFYTNDDVEAYRHITQSPVNAEAHKKTFRLYHLNAMHEPFALTAEAGRNPDGADTTPMEQAQGTFLIVNTLLAQLQDAGVYDNTAIIITADHVNSAHVDEMALEEPIFSPTLLYKPINERGKLKTSDAPASLMDIRATVLSAAGLPYDETEGMPLSTIYEGQERTRYFSEALAIRASLRNLA